jgi:hypothetical protein
MTEKPTNVPRVSVALSGNMLQFNITLLFLIIFLLGVLYICSNSTNPFLIYGGTVVVLICLLAVILFVFYFYLKQKSSPFDGQAVAVSITNESGNQLSVQNPPDSFFEQGEMNAMVRLMLVGYDENLCPDGEVIGKAADQNYRQYSEEEKALFRKRHRNEIRGKRMEASRMLVSGEAVKDKKQSGDSDNATSAEKKTS